MRLRFVPGRWFLRSLTAAGLGATVALFAQVPLRLVGLGAAVFSTTLLALTFFDLWLTRRTWRGSQVQMTRRLPSAFALGVRQTVHLQFPSSGARALRCAVFDHCDASLDVRGLPAEITLLPGKRVEMSYDAIPTRRSRGSTCRRGSTP